MLRFTSFAALTLTAEAIKISTMSHHSKHKHTDLAQHPKTFAKNFAQLFQGGAGGGPARAPDDTNTYCDESGCYGPEGPVGGNGGPPAGGPPPGAGMPMPTAADMFEMMDKDKDGKVTLEEAKQGTIKMLRKEMKGQLKMMLESTDAMMPEMFKRADTNGDGAVTLDELEAAMGPPPMPAPMEPPMEPTQQMEAQLPKKTFAQLFQGGGPARHPDDTNTYCDENGCHGPEGPSGPPPGAGMQPPTPKEMFEAMDKDKDGKLTLEEAIQGTKKMLKQQMKKQLDMMIASTDAMLPMMFTEADKNGDGTITLDELEAAMGPPPPPPMSEEHCRCFANGGENEPVCENQYFGIYECLDMGDKCHWGPGESTQCQMEVDMFHNATAGTPPAGMENPGYDELFYENENPETGEHFNGSGEPDGEFDENFDPNAENYPIENYDKNEYDWEEGEWEGNGSATQEAQLQKVKKSLY